MIALAETAFDVDAFVADPVSPSVLLLLRSMRSDDIEDGGGGGGGGGGGRSGVAC